MRLFSLAAAWAAALVAAPAAPAAAASGDQFAYLAYGDMRGHIEPCGCDPATDMGGLRRIAARVERERRLMPSLLLLNLGNGLAPVDEPALKTPFLLEGAAALAPTAYLFNETEMQRLAAVKAYAGKLPFVLSNAKPGALPKGLVADRIDAADAVVLGYASTPALKKATVPYSPAMAERWRKALAGAGGKRKVLLFAGDDKELDAIVRAKIFDVVVSSNTSPLTTLAGTAEKDDETRLERRVVGTVVYMTPIGAQGILRGGKLMFEEAKDISSLLQDKTTAPFGKDAPPPIFAKARVVTWLDPATGGEEQLKDLFARYNAAAKAAFADAGAARLAQLAKTPYAGAAACQGCHMEAFKVWQGSAHAHAMATLQAKNKHEDPECVQCHSVGASAPGGFVSLEHSPQFANVQCENCHGPRLAHTQDPKKRPAGAPKGAEACASCHNAQHSPRFDFKTYWPKIEHR